MVAHCRLMAQWFLQRLISTNSWRRNWLLHVIGNKGTSFVLEMYGSRLQPQTSILTIRSSIQRRPGRPPAFHTQWGPCWLYLVPCFLGLQPTDMDWGQTWWITAGTLPFAWRNHTSHAPCRIVHFQRDNNDLYISTACLLNWMGRPIPFFSADYILLNCKIEKRDIHPCKKAFPMHNTYK